MHKREILRGRAPVWKGVAPPCRRPRSRRIVGVSTKPQADDLTSQKSRRQPRPPNAPHLGAQALELDPLKPCRSLISPARLLPLASRKVTMTLTGLPMTDSVPSTHAAVPKLRPRGDLERRAEHDRTGSDYDNARSHGRIVAGEERPGDAPNAACWPQRGEYSATAPPTVYLAAAGTHSRSVVCRAHNCIVHRPAFRVCSHW